MRKANRAFEMHPFERFIMLRFLQVEIDELYEELLDRNFIFEGRFSRDHLIEKYEHYLAAVPEKFRKIVSKQAPPAAKDEEDYEVFLTMIGVYDAYCNPSFDESFDFICESNAKALLDALCNTRSSVEEICDLTRQSVSRPGAARIGPCS